MRIIGHLDMDAFFAAIEERDNPRLNGKPIVVGADPMDGRGRGVVSTANYAAREYGIRSALPITAAWRFSEAARRKGLPPAVFLPVNMEKYHMVSASVMGILRGYAKVVEEASVDEAYFDLSLLPDGASCPTYEATAEVAKNIKVEIREKERLTASVGIGPNKLIAKIASDRRKPDGLTVVREEDAEKFLEPLPIRTIPGVGPKTEERMKKLGVRAVGDAKRFGREELIEMMGKWGAELYEKLRGRDEAPLVTEWVAKSVGEQETFPLDTHDPKFLREQLMALADGVWRRFIAEGFTSFRSVTITVRFADFTTLTRRTTLDAPVLGDHARETLQFQALRLFMPFLDRRENPARKAFRLLGVRVEQLT